MQHHAQKFFDEFRQMIELFWWSFIKAPAAFIAAWGFFSMLSNPAKVASQSMQIVHNGGGLPPELMTGVVTAWFLCACSVLSVALLARVIFRVNLLQQRQGDAGNESYSVFHP
ncbi:MAG: hypothetical protein Q9M23_07400 [Mariprofundaceae bacterium]|nr:hypothetical protein [Mariprofundaceae bacterium]